MNDEAKTTPRTDAAARGAGSGENAVRERTKSPQNKKGKDGAELPEGLLPEGKSLNDYKPENYDPDSEFPEGDATKGKPDYQAIAEGCTTVQPIAMRDHRAYLISQAEKNQRANDELQARAVEGGAKDLSLAAGLLLDPDFQRDTSVQNALAELDMHSKEYVDNYKERRAKATKAAATVPDTAPGNNRTVQGTPVPAGTIEPAKR
jgi:hypothetical protein